MFAKEAKARMDVGRPKEGVASLPQVNQGKARDQAAAVVGVSGKMRSRQIHFSHNNSSFIQCNRILLSEHKRK